MPTPTGLPTKGDLYIHQDGIEVEVVKREGTGIVYSVILRRLDGQLMTGGNHPVGYPRDHFRVTEFAWYIQRGLFTLKDKR